MHASSGTNGHAVAPDVGVAARVDAVRTDTDGHRRVHAAGLFPMAFLLAAARAGFLAAALLLAAAVVRTEHAATRERRSESPRRERDLDRLSDDLVHSAPRFLLSICL